MSYANYPELTQCLKDGLAYCEEHPERSFAAFFAPRLVKAHQQLEEAFEQTDRYFSQWRMESGEDRLAWKHLAHELRQTQDRLKRINAMGYPERRILYWDRERLVVVVDEMIDYLKQHSDQIDFAAGQVEKLERQLDMARNEDTEAVGALKTYNRFVQFRSDALSNATNTIASFRREMRKELGIEHPEYKQIRWPFAVAPDERVL